LTVRNSLKTQSPIPEWAAEKVKESWNVGVKFNFAEVGPLHFAFGVRECGRCRSTASLYSRCVRRDQLKFRSSTPTFASTTKNPHQNCICKSRCPKDAISRRYRAARALPQSPIHNHSDPGINSAVSPTTAPRLHNESRDRNFLCLLP
jgi:hypothetical protein